MGAHERGLIVEDPLDFPNNLMPFIAQIAVGQQSELRLFEADYPTIDGTGVRGYIHAMDLAEGHEAALRFVSQTTGWNAINLGGGKGFIVLQMIRALEKVSGRKVPFEVESRRMGDVAMHYSDPKNASKTLDWHAKRSLDDVCTSACNSSSLKAR